MDTIAELIETALADIGIEVYRLFNPNNDESTYIVYNKVSDNIEERADDTDLTALFYIDVDIYTTDPSIIDRTRRDVETRLKQAGFMQRTSGATIVEDDTEPIWYHEPLEFSFKKELV